MIVEEISKQYGNRILFENINFEIETGVLFLKGNSGTGKSTFIDIVLGVKKPTCGRIIHKGGTLISTSLQCETLFENKSLYENLIYLNTNYDIALLNHYLGIFSFRYLLNEKIVNLSGGERKKAELIFCLLKKANIYIFDEPFSSLDKETKMIVKEIIEELRNKSLVIISNHDEDIVIEPDIIFDLNNNVVNILNINDKKCALSETHVENKLLLYTKTQTRSRACIIFLLILMISFSFLLSFSNINNTVDQINTCLQHENFENYLVSYKKSVKPINDKMFKEDYSTYISLDFVKKVGLYEVNNSYIFIESEKLEDEIYSLKSKMVSTMISIDNIHYTLENKNIDILIEYKYQDFFITKLKNDFYNNVFLTPKGFVDRVLLLGSDKIKFNNDDINFEPFFRKQIDTVFKNYKVDIIDNETYKYYFAKKTNDLNYDIMLNNTIIENVKVVDNIVEDNKIIMNLNQFKDFVIHYNAHENSNGAIKELNSFDYVINKKDYKKINNYGQFVVYTPLYTLNDSFYGGICLIVFVFLFMLFIFNMSFDYKNKIRNIGKIYSCYVRNGLSKSIFYKDVALDLAIELIPILCIYSISYCLCLKLSNYINMITHFTKKNGYYYYSEAPINNYYDYLNSPIKLNTYSNLFILGFAFIVIYIIYKLLILKKIENQNK